MPDVESVATPPLVLGDVIGLIALNFVLGVILAGIEHLGGAVRVPPREVVNVSQFSIFGDPQNASLCPISKTPQRTW